MPKPLSAAANELLADVVKKTFATVRQSAAERKKIKDREDTAFAKLAQETGLTKKEFMVAFRRCEKDETQMNLFDQNTMRIESVLRDIIGEKVKAKDADREEDHEKEAKGKKSSTPKAAKKAAKSTKADEKKAAAGKSSTSPNVVPIGKKVDAASPKDLPGQVNGGTPRRQSARAQAQAGFKDHTPRMSADELNKLQAANTKPS